MEKKSINSIILNTNHRQNPLASTNSPTVNLTPLTTMYLERGISYDICYHARFVTSPGLAGLNFVMFVRLVDVVPPPKKSRRFGLAFSTELQRVAYKSSISSRTPSVELRLGRALDPKRTEHEQNVNSKSEYIFSSNVSNNPPTNALIFPLFILSTLLHVSVP